MQVPVVVLTTSPQPLGKNTSKVGGQRDTGGGGYFCFEDALGLSAGLVCVRTLRKYVHSE